jgi:hypothetical protein
MVFRRRDLKLLAVLALVANALFLACLIANLGAFLMRRMIHLAALAAAAIALSACAGMPLGGVQTQASPAIQKTQAEANARLSDALANRLDHCAITGTVTFKVGVAPDAGLANTAGLSCPAKPWETPRRP